QDEVEELRCEMLEMRDMFQEEEVYQLQELRLQLEQANKTCRILQYRLRKAERRSIRVAQTGQVDGELVRSLEHDIKSTLRRKTVRSSSKTERRLSQPMEDDSADLRCQLHFAREELALMCKKLTKLVSESEAAREELGQYRSAFGDLDVAQLPEGTPDHGRSRGAELLLKPPQNGHCCSPPAPEADPSGRTPRLLLPAPLSEALELLQAMLVAFIGRTETLARGEDSGKPGVPAGGAFSFPSGGGADPSQERVEDLRTSEVKEREKPARPAALEQSCGDPKMRVWLQILRILHQWFQDRGSKPEEKQSRDQTVPVLRKLLQELSAELQEDRSQFSRASKAAEGIMEASEGRRSKAHRSKGKSLYGAFSPRGCVRKNWCYVSREAAQLDRGDPVKTWHHLIMPLSFPGLDFEQMSLERSHTAPEKSALRIYYSPPSARRVQLSPPERSPAAEAESERSASPWCTPPTSFSQLCLGSSANLSDDMKEMTVSWRRERGGALAGQWVGVASSGTQTQVRPQMVSVGLQTDAPHVRGSPSRPPARSHLSASLEGVQGRGRNSTPSPNLYLRNSAHSASSPHLSADLSPASPAPSSSRERALWNLHTHSHAGLAWTRQSGHGAAEAAAAGTRPPGKAAAANRYGMVTEFLRRVSGRAEKTVPAPGPKAKSGLKNPERVPIRPPPTASLHRSDSVTRIVNRRFMKQREEAARAQKDEKEKSGARPSPGARTADDGSYDCSSGSTLTFCFARSSRSSLRQASNQARLHRHTHSPPVGAAAGPQACE
ncbi:unnamed protein product, partial [Tetraodon nigroviridis]